MKKVKVGVVGVGHLGQHHARIYAQAPPAQLVGVVDIDRARATKIGRQYRTQAFFDYKYLLGKVEAVSIAVPTELHYEIARDFMEHGVHVLVEKPITKLVSEAQELISLAREKQLILQVGHIEQFNVAVKKMKKMVDNPGFIEVHRLGDFDPRVKDIGVVMDLMIHDVDIILRLVPSTIKKIEAIGVPVLTDKEDIANARITFENGCIANITVSRVTPKKLRKIRIFQKDCYISLDYERQAMDVHLVERTQRKDGLGKPERLVRKKVRVKKDEPLKSELHHFLDCVIKGRSPEVSGEQALRALEVVVQVSHLVKEHLETVIAKQL